MLKSVVLPADLFTVVNKTVLHEEDRKLLTMLYQPMIGADAIGLYFSLCTYLDKMEIISDVWTHHHLMTNLRMGLEEIVSAREKLEAVGLVKSYVKKANMNQFVYEIYSPLSAFEFFNNPLLSTVLYNDVGETEYQKLVSYFSLPKVPLKEYEDITCRFQDVFEMEDMTNFEQLLNDLKQTKKNKIEIMASIDLEHIFSMIPEEMLNLRSITLETKEFLYRISFVYGFNDEEMTELLKSSFTLKRTIDKEKLKENARNYYKFEHVGNLPSLALKNQPEYLRKKNLTTSLRDKKIYEFETTNPHDYLYSRHTGTRLTSQEIAILDYLLIEMNLNPGVVNVILDYVLTESDNKLVPTYVESVAGLFSRSKIKTVEEAMNLAEKEHKKRKQAISKKTTKHTEKKPDWIDKNFEVKEASFEEQKQMQDWISKVIK
jgi:replication initiation and membrane attachment protein